MALTYRPQSEGFLGLDDASGGNPADAKAVIVPFGLEATVSYGSGTAHGPEAIIKASPQLEFFDEGRWSEPYRDFGIATLSHLTIAHDIEAALFQLGETVADIVSAGKFPMVLGGEHALTPGAIRPLLRRYSDLVVVQFDAHADLRDGYQGHRFSHAAAMRRVLDDERVSLVQVGIRAISAEEIAFWEANQHRISTFWARDKTVWSASDIVRAINGRPVYLSFDVDGLDASVMPATGTPEPGGLSFDQAISIIDAVAQTSSIVAADVVELSPIQGFHAYDFTAAKLVYKILSAALARPLR